MTSISLRLPTALAARLTRAAQAEGVSRNALIVSILDDETAQSQVVAGYVEVTGGELDGAECPECCQPMERVFVGFTVGAVGPRTFGPVCGGCATTE